jgi:hypothetical protein
MKLPTKQLEVNHKASTKLTREILVSSVWEVLTIPFTNPASWHACQRSANNKGNGMNDQVLT